MNNDRTLILLTFDENETYDIQNRIFTLALGGAVPEELKGTEDNTFYTHYSTISSVEANWGLGSLGRGDTNKYCLSFHVKLFHPDRLAGHFPTSMNSSLSRLATKMLRLQTRTFLYSTLPEFTLVL